MPKISFPWVNGGADFDIKDLPAKGHKDINRLRTERAKLIADYRKALLIARRAVILGTKKAMEKHGAEKAKAIWDSEAKEIFTDEREGDLNWSKEDFEKNLNSWFDEFVLGQLKCKTLQEAERKIEEDSEKIDVVQIQSRAQELFIDILVAEIYWRLRGQFDTISMPDGKTLPLTIPNLEEVVVYPGDALRLRGIDPKKLPVPLEEEMKDKTEGEILKNS